MKVVVFGVVFWGVVDDNFFVVVWEFEDDVFVFFVEFEVVVGGYVFFVDGGVVWCMCVVSYLGWWWKI